MASGDRAATQRLFVGLWPSPEAVSHLASALSERRGDTDIYPDTLRWQPPERWHLTLAFLGQADPDRTRSRLSRISLLPAEPLRLAGAGTFGPVLWIGVEHGPWLLSLGSAVRRALRADDGKSRPHLTIARARGAAGLAHARAAADALTDHAGPAWIPEALTLVRSFTGPSPRYEVIESWPLARAE